MPPKIILTFVSKYGLPTALALVLLWALLSLQKAVLIDLRNDVDHLSRIVDLSCQPSKPPP